MRVFCPASSTPRDFQRWHCGLLRIDADGRFVEQKDEVESWKQGGGQVEAPFSCLPLEKFPPLSPARSDSATRFRASSIACRAFAPGERGKVAAKKLKFYSRRGELVHRAPCLAGRGADLQLDRGSVSLFNLLAFDQDFARIRNSVILQ